MASSPCSTLVLAKRNIVSLHPENQIGDRPCFVTIDTEAFVIIARPDITTGPPPERKLSQLVSGEALLVLEILLDLPLG
jgi:hypothetical protein